MSNRPVLVIRAYVDPAVEQEFNRWYREVHLVNVMKIPGLIKAYRCSSTRPGINWMALYEFRDEAAVQEAFASAEASQARKDWERWGDQVRDMSVEVYTQLNPLPAYHHWN
ncbi:MAG TPA: EthD family reductase [Dehalococcoidia bacterium]|nr:EthD family reductase [Dehalococcoidia bacterium]